MLKSGFFDASLVNEEYDRIYDSQDFADCFSNFIVSGIVPNVLGSFKVSPTTPASNKVVVSTGKAWIEGRWVVNDEEIELPISISTSGTTTYGIVLRLDKANREISIKAINNTGISWGILYPIRNDSTFDLLLGTISLQKGATKIDYVSDMRYSQYCGMAYLNLNYKDTDIVNLLNSWENQANADYLVYLNMMSEYKQQLVDLIDEEAAGHLLNQINKLRDDMEEKKLNVPNTSIDGCIYMKGSDKSTSTKLPYEIVKLSGGIVKLRLIVNSVSGAVTISPDTIKAITSPHLYIDVIPNSGMGKWVYEILSAKMTIDNEYDFLNYYTPSTSYSPVSKISVRLEKDGGITINFSTGMRGAHGYVPETCIDLFFIRKDVENVVEVEGSTE